MNKKQHKIKKQRTQKAMLRDNRKSLREEQSKRPQHQANLSESTSSNLSTEPKISQYH